MKHRATESFWRLYDTLPERVRAQADQAFALLRSDSQHPSLHFKPIGRFRSARVSRQYRALAIAEGDDCIWFWIGNHDDYDRLLRRG